MSAGSSFLRGKRILVTGASGFLGRHLSAALAEGNPASLTLLSRSGTFQAVPLAEMVALDLLDREATLRFLKSRTFDFIYHLAGKIDQRVWPGVYDEQFRLHVQTTLNLTDGLMGRSLERFFHFGSSMEYGNAPYPQVNRERERPLSAYGVSKLASSKIVLARTHSEELPGVVLRPFLVYGHGQGESSFLQSAIRAAHGGEEFATTAGSQTRDFTPVAKFVDDTLAVTALPHEEAIGEIFNVCTGVEIYVREVVEMLRQHYAGFRPEVGVLPYRRSEVMHSVGAAFRPWEPQRARAELERFLTETP